MPPFPQPHKGVPYPHRRRPMYCMVGVVSACFAVGWVLLSGTHLTHDVRMAHQDQLPLYQSPAPHFNADDGGSEAATHVARDRPAAVCEALQPHANVSAVLENFALCFDPETCRGTLSFAYIDATLCEKRRRTLSRNATLQQHLTDVVGPDVFRFRLEGPETIAGTASRVGNRGCAYVVQIPQLHHAGSYRLGLEWLYRDYDAMDEMTNHWPPLIKQSLLPVDGRFSTRYHLQQCTLPSTTVLSCSRTIAVDDGGLPCTGLEADSSGRWVLDEEHLDDPVFTRVRVKKIQRSPIVFQWALQADAARHWHPHSCRLLPLTSARVLPHLAEHAQRIVIGGDSQLRALYFGLSNFLNGHGDDCLRNISTEAAEPRHCIENVKGSQRKRIGGVQLDFVDDLFLDRFASTERYASYQTIVVGFGQHPASKEHWSLDKYRASFGAKLRKAVQLQRSGKQVVWYLAPQYPHTTHGFPVFVRDWRTDVRLSTFNAFAKAQCLAHGIPVVDAFAITTPYSHTSPDQAHFSNFVSFELVRMTLNVVCSQLRGGCGDGKGN